MNDTPPSNDGTATNTIGLGAANALALLLREDPLLLQHGLTSYQGISSPFDGQHIDNDGGDDAAYSYAASLLCANGGEFVDSSGWMSSSGERATEALAEVDRKLALVESLAQRVSRDAPEKVAGPLLRLHGFDLVATHNNANARQADVKASNTTTITATRDKVERLRRQSEVLDTVARRVESTLQRGVSRMESATTRLSRVLELSSTLKMMLRLQFEARKVHESGLDLESMNLDLRDLTRAAASVAAMEELLAHPSLTPKDGGGMGVHGTIDVVEKLRPEADAVATSVRQAAAGLMNELQSHPLTSGSASSLSRLGATLQVYFHLGELSDATWKAVASALTSAEKANAQLFHPTAIQQMNEAAKSEARALAEAEALKIAKEEESSANSGSSSKLDPRQRKKQTEATYERLYHRKLREKRAAAASKWATGVSDAASRVWNLHRVLARRNDPVSRKNFLEVVAESEVPKEFGGAEERLVRVQNEKDGIDGERSSTLSKANFSLFSLFWVQLCIGLGGRVQRLLRYDNSNLEGDVAALYPAICAASLEMVTELYDVMQMGSSSSDDAAAGLSSTGTGWSSVGVMGGSAGLENSVFLGMDGKGDDDVLSKADEAAGGFLGGASADVWTHVETSSAGDVSNQSSGLARSGGASSATSSSTLAVFSSAEWIALQGGKRTGDTTMGLMPLQCAFLSESKKRLFAPLKFMFPEAVAVDEDGVALPVLPTLPSRYDLAKLDANIREELSLADPRQGGGDLSMTTMISETVVSMLHEFCSSAKRAISDAGEDRIVDPRTGSATESIKHNLKVAVVMVRLCLCEFAIEQRH